MSDATKAVFLSYAREDTDAARRIADALRAFGVEVWFDQSELRGGDTWDSKIKKQIRDCALFLPLVSQQTQERSEGYFRREWLLAVERTRDMAHGVAFIVPVVIDETREAEAAVPEEFMRFHWTRLAHGVPSPEFVMQVKKLLEAPRKPTSSARPAVVASTSAAPRSSGFPTWLAAVVGVALLGVIGYLALRPAAKEPASSANPVAETKPAAPSPLATSPAPATTAADDKSVAVLAFADLSEARNSEYFSDGISEELLNVLAKVPGLRVAARTSAFFFKGKNLPIPEIAAKLNVAYVVEGSVQRAGDHVRITAQLIKAADGYHVWSEHFDRELKNVFALQDEIAGLIAKQLSLKLGASSSAAIAAVNPQAFELYVRAREAWKLRTLADYDRAEELLNRALALAPNFARAHAALADVWFLRAQDENRVGSFAQRNSPEFARIVAKINQALALDPESAEAHTSRGGVAWMAWDAATAERELRRAIALNPNYATAHQWLGRVLLHEGRLDEGLAELKLATELDPLAPRILDNYAIGLFLAGRHAKAIELVDRALTLQPNSLQGQCFKATYLMASARVADAVALARTLPGNQDPFARATQATVFAQAGLKAEAVVLLADFSRKDEGYKLRCLLALGRTEEAIALLNPENIFANLQESFLFEPLYDPIRQNPRIVKLLVEIGATEAHARAQAWRAAHPPEQPTAKK